MVGLTSVRNRLFGLADTDICIIIWTILMSGIGFVFVYSSSALLAQRSSVYGYEPYYFLQKQVVAGIIGMTICAGIATFVNWRQIERWSGWILLASIFLLILVFVPGIGTPIANVNRWIRVGGVSFQPAELAKLALVLYLAKFISDRQSRWISGMALCKALAIAGVVALLIYKEPDYSTAVFVMFFTLLMLFLGGLSWTYVGVTIATVIALAAYGLATKSYILHRVHAYLRPWADPSAQGFQILQSYIALDRGALTGAGLGHSLQKTALLPEPHTDFIFAVIGEETGFLGAGGIAVMFLAFMVYGVRMAYRMPNLFLKLASAGIVFMISLQALSNMLVVTGLMPVSGEPLPLISAGGSSMMITLIAIGCLLTFSREAQATLPVPTEARAAN